MDEFFDAISKLPSAIQNKLLKIPAELIHHVQEIHLRSDRPIVLTTENGEVIPDILSQPVSQKDIYNCFLSLCDYSVHSFELQIARGYFTLKGGHRIGIAGVINKDQGGLKGIRLITSLCIRISRCIQCQLPQEIQIHLVQPDFRGLLLSGPPCSGKTTMLREISSELSKSGGKISIIDERMEIWPCDYSGFIKTPPLNCDILSGVDKTEGIIQALRCMGPKAILCDELSGKEELSCMVNAVKSGVQFVCTIHGQDISSMIQQNFGSEHIIKQLFSCVVQLNRITMQNRIKEIRFL